jgi:hypothetical protein
MQLLPLITWVINTTPTSALPKGNTPYNVWFGQQPLINLQDHEGNARRIRTVPGEGNESRESSIIKVTEGEEDREDSLFINQEAELEEAVEGMILSKLTKRVTEHIRKQKERIVKKANSKALEYTN